MTLKPTTDPRAGTNSKPGEELVAVMTVRERYGLTVESLRSLRAELTNGQPIYLVFDDHFPAEILAAIKIEFASVKVMKIEGQWRQNEIRKKAIAGINAEYILFVDNDVEFREGSVAKLLECARNSNAAIVSTIVTYGRARFETIHFGGGSLAWETDGQGLHLIEHHLFMNKSLTSKDGQVERGESAFAELHCQLMSKQAYLLDGMLDPAFQNAHNHISDSLVAKAAGLKVFVEPEAVVHWHHKRNFSFRDMQYFDFQWDLNVLEKTIARFCSTWRVVDSERSFEPLRNYVRRHRAFVLSKRDHLKPNVDLNRALSAGQIAQDISSLIAQARNRGYNSEDIEMIEEMYWVAARITVGGFRPSGRPYLNHLVGTASILVHFGFNVRLVAAGLLYSAATLNSTNGQASSEHWLKTRQHIANTVLADLIELCPKTLMNWTQLVKEPWQANAKQYEIEALIIFCAAHLEAKFESGNAPAESEQALPAMLADPLNSIFETYGMKGFWASLSFDDDAGQEAKLKPASFRIHADKFWPLIAVNA